MVDFTKSAALAQRLIEANGRTVTIYKRSRTAEDSAEPWRGPDTTPDDTETVIAVFVPVTGSGLGISQMFEPDLAKTFDSMCMVAQDSLSDGVDLNEFDTLVDDTDSFKIQKVATLKPGDTTVLYGLGLVR